MNYRVKEGTLLFRLLV